MGYAATSIQTYIAKSAIAQITPLCLIQNPINITSITAVKIWQQTFDFSEIDYILISMSGYTLADATDHTIIDVGTGAAAVDITTFDNPAVTILQTLDVSAITGKQPIYISTHNTTPAASNIISNINLLCSEVAYP